MSSFGENENIAALRSLSVPRRPQEAEMAKQVRRGSDHAALGAGGRVLARRPSNGLREATFFRTQSSNASSGGRLPEALFMVFQLDSKDAKVGNQCGLKPGKITQKHNEEVCKR